MQQQWINTEMEVTYTQVDGLLFINSASLYINGVLIDVTDKVKDELTKMINNDIPNS